MVQLLGGYFKSGGTPDKKNNALKEHSIMHIKDVRIVSIISLICSSLLFSICTVEITSVSDVRILC
jgi:hypothetical protein